MRYCLGTLQLILAFLAPTMAWGRSERHDYRERQRLQWDVKRTAKEAGRTKTDRPWPYFKLDVF